MSIEQDVTDALEKLAAEGSPEGVALRLEAERCAGARSEPSTCPVAQFVRKTTSVEVAVGMERWTTALGQPPIAGGPKRLPPVVTLFIRRFDLGCYPALDARRAW